MSRNLTFFIGNGFDLNLNMKTSYEDFYEYYLEKKKTTNDKDILKLIENIKEDLKGNRTNWADAEIGFGNYSSFFDSKESVKYKNVYMDFATEMTEYLLKQQKQYVIKETYPLLRYLKEWYKDYRYFKGHEERIGEGLLYRFISLYYSPIESAAA